jgi:phage-related protein
MPETFTAPWVRAHKRKISFKTNVDSEYTAHEQREAVWASPRKTWTLSFEKTPEDMAAVEAFFIARRGKFNAFNWVYSSIDKYGRPTGGDNQTYLVRFDSDDLDETISTMGYSTFDIDIVQVVTSE